MMFAQLSIKYLFLVANLLLVSVTSLAIVPLDLAKPLTNCNVFELDKNSNYKIASDNKLNLFFIKNQSKIESFNVRTNSQNWNFSFGEKENNIFYINNQYVLFFESNSETKLTTLRMLNNLNGLVDWQTDFLSESIKFISFSKNLIVLTDQNNFIFVIDVEKHKIIRTFKYPELIQISPYILDDNLVISIPNFLHIYSITENKVLRQLGISEIPSALLVNEDNLIVGTTKGNIELIDLPTFSLKTDFKVGGKITHITKTNSGILISSLDNYLYTFSNENLKLIWKNKTSGRNVFAPVVIDDYIINTNFGMNSFDIISVRNGKVINKILAESNNIFLEKPEFLDGSIVYLTLKGLYIYKNSDCK